MAVFRVSPPKPREYRPRSACFSSIMHSPMQATFVMAASPGSGHELAAKFVLDVNPDDVIEGLFGRGETELQRPLRLEITRPAADDADNERIRLALDAGGDLVARHPLQRGDLFADGRGQAGHGEIAARADDA